MKKIILSLFTCLICTSVFAQVQQVDPILLVKTLEKNRNTEITFVTELNLNNLGWDNEGNLKLTNANSEKYSLIAEIETEFLRERLNYKYQKYKVSFQLKSSKPKVYAVTKIEGLETVAEYKARIEAERLARLEAERIAEEKRLEEERLAEEARLEAERIAEEARLEAERIAEEKRQRNAQYLPTYEGHLAKAKKYETEKRWCYALGSYYDAMGTVGLDPEYKTEAVNGYNALKESILSGNPGFGTYNAFTLHDEWKRLLIDAEKYGCSFNPYEVTVGDLVQGDLDYTSKTASYSAEISYKIGARYMYTIRIIEDGYKIAYKDDWSKLPKEWPKYSVSYKDNDAYNVNGAYIFIADEYDLYGKVIDYSYYNAFGINHNFTYRIDVQIPFTSRIENIFYQEIDTLIDCKFNIVDENGKELVKPVRCLLGRQSKVLFSGITPEIMNLIDNDKAFINPIGCYLQYGKYDSKLDKGGRSFIKNFPEVQLPLETAEIICWNNKFDKTYDSINKSKAYEIKQKFDTDYLNNINNINFDMISITEKNLEIAKTETTQELYESVMGSNPSKFKFWQNPVENISFYDAIYFCNKLSIIKGLTPVYSVDRNIDFTEWNYTPHEGHSIEGEITQNLSANGYRLPTLEEWQYAARGGEDYDYAGSNDLYEVAWFEKNSNSLSHYVAQKKANGYGLYDMSGNVSELCWESDIGGGYSDWPTDCKVSISPRINTDRSRYGSSHKGFRIVRSYK